MAGTSKPWRPGGAGLIVMLRLTPGSSRDRIEGVGPVQGGVALKARVRAVPEKGKANAAAERLLGKWLGVPATSVRLKSGGASRLKSIEVAGDPAGLAAAIEAALDRHCDGHGAGHGAGQGAGKGAGKGKGKG